MGDVSLNGDLGRSGCRAKAREVAGAAIAAMPPR